MPPSLPLEIIAVVASHITSPSTLSSLAQTSHAVYDLIHPLLYAHLTFPTESILSSFIRSHNVGLVDTTTANRHRQCLESVKSIYLESPPSSTTASLILSLADYMPKHHVFPNCHTYTITSRLIDHLPTRAVSTSYNTSKATIKVYESIRRLARPTVLHLQHSDSTTPSTETASAAWGGKHDKEEFLRSLSSHWPELKGCHWGMLNPKEIRYTAKVINVYGIGENNRSKALELMLLSAQLQKEATDGSNPPEIAIRLVPTIGSRLMAEKFSEDLLKLWESFSRHEHTQQHAFHHESLGKTNLVIEIADEA